MTNLKAICERLGGRLAGDPDKTVSTLSPLEKAGADEIAFVAKKEIDPTGIKAGALIVQEGSSISYPNLIFVRSPYLAFAALLEYFYPRQRFNSGVDPRAAVSGHAVLGSDVSIGPFSYVAGGSQIGDHTEIHAGVTIYPRVKIGRNCLIYSHTVIRENVEIGDHVIIQPGAVIGGDGFGFARDADGTPVKIPQVGKVIIGDFCEIGANTCIDRSTLEETELKEYVKLDNLVQIGHNVVIGKGTAVSSQSGISGSSRIGANVIIGGQVGVADHVRIADGVMIAAKSGVTGSIKTKMVVAGIPHVEIARWRKNWVIFRNLDQVRERLNVLEQIIRDLEAK